MRCGQRHLTVRTSFKFQAIGTRPNYLITKSHIPMSKITLKPFGSDQPEAGYIAWSPVPLNIEGSNPTGNTSVTLRSRPLNNSISRVLFMSRIGAVPVEELEVTLKNGLASVYVAGKFQPGKRHNGASEEAKDVLIEAVWSDNSHEVAGSVEVMIRVRKNANDLSVKARNDFLDALATLNGIKSHPAFPNQPPAGPGKGIYVTDFVGMHVGSAYSSAHGDSHFLPWHRLYLLDLERLLQKARPEVSLPYWRFDEPAPNVFTEEFMGATEHIPSNTPQLPGSGTPNCVTFSLNNPLYAWQIG
ncbi:MAG: tyrosinase family protein, partial [Akkermansiaceae bacterium]|nr:tyrosinase family protein [Akkermansiaceae bacterium]